MKNRLATFAICALAVAACTPQTVTVEVPQTVVVKVTVPVTVPVTVEVTRVQTVEVTRIAQVIVTATASKTPTFTPSPLYTPTNTGTPTKTPTPTPTPNSAKTATAQAFAKMTSPKGDGFYLVNVDIAPGVWRSEGKQDNCYWAKTRKNGDIIDNHFGLAGGTMYVAQTDFQVQMQNCGRWTYIGPP